jgi:16S rRNA (uracil1498-N3)-methyltransferase
MRQFILPASWDGGVGCEIMGRDAHRLTAVLRLGPGDSFPALAADGSSYACTIVEAGHGRVLLSVAASASTALGYRPDVRAGAMPTNAIDAFESAVSAAPMPRLRLAVGFLKGSSLDDVVRMATESGVADIIPLVTERSVPMDHTAGRVERLRRVVTEALGQSGSPVPTRVEDPISISDLCNRTHSADIPGLRLFFHEMPLAQATIHRYCTDTLEEILACVGPEGGFSEAEIGALSGAGFQPAWLGPTVLRAGTAAIFAIASIRIVCLERSSWSMIESRE